MQSDLYHYSVLHRYAKKGSYLIIYYYRYELIEIIVYHNTLNADFDSQPLLKYFRNTSVCFTFDNTFDI
jgi:hypothetical protein